MHEWTSGRFKEVNVDQLATATDRALVGRVPTPALARGSAANLYDETSTSLTRYRRAVDRPSLLACAFVFACGMVLGLITVGWPLT
jgi:hypothetical protein